MFTPAIIRFRVHLQVDQGNLFKVDQSPVWFTPGVSDCVKTNLNKLHQKCSRIWFNWSKQVLCESDLTLHLGAHYKEMSCLRQECNFKWAQLPFKIV